MTIEDIYDRFKDRIHSIYPTGSSMLGFIEPHDMDYLVIVNDDECAREIRSYSRSSRDGKRLDLHIVSLNGLEQQLSKLPVWAFLYHYIDESGPIYGERMAFGVDVLERREQYAKVLKAYKLHLDYLRAQGGSGTVKNYYYLFAGAFTLFNNSYELNDVQKSMIERAHDRDVTDGDLGTLCEILDSFGV